MAATLNMSSFNNKDSLLRPNIKQGDIMNRTNGLNYHGLVGFQWKIMKGMWFLLGCMLLFMLLGLEYICNLNYILSFKAEQDEDLEKLEETVTSTKHISLVVNEKLSLHTRLLAWFFTDLVSIVFSFSWCSVVHHPICAYDFCSNITLWFCIICNKQDNLD